MLITSLEDDDDEGTFYNFKPSHSSGDSEQIGSQLFLFQNHISASNPLFQKTFPTKIRDDDSLRSCQILLLLIVHHSY